MMQYLTKALLAACWFMLLTFPVMGIKLNSVDQTVEWQFDRVILLGVAIFFLSMLWNWCFSRKARGIPLIRLPEGLGKGLHSLVTLPNRNTTTRLTSLGLLLAAVGMDPDEGTERLTFGILDLCDGIPLMPLALGLMAVSELFRQSETSFFRYFRGLGLQEHVAFSTGRPEDEHLSWKEYKSLLPTIFRSTGNSAVSMKVSVIVNAINFCGNALCVFVLKMGVAGVAVPTLISRAVGAVIILSLAARPDYVLQITPRSVTRLEGKTVKSILYIGVPSAFENSLFQLGRVLVVSMISLFGTVHISANAVANNLDAIGCIVGNAMGLAMITVVGRCVGAQDFEQTKYYTKKLLLWDYIAQGAVNVTVLLLLNEILSMYTLTPETRALAFTLVMIHNGFSILLWPASFVLPNALRAANDVRYTMVVATISMLVWRMGLSWVLCVNMGMGAVGVWYAMLVDWVCRVICFVARFATGAWKKNAVKKV